MGIVSKHPSMTRRIRSSSQDNEEELLVKTAINDVGIPGRNIQQSNPLDMSEEEKATNARERALAESVPAQRTQIEEVGQPKARPKGQPTISALPPEMIEMIFSKLPLRDFVQLHFGCSKEWRLRTSSRVFEGEPFFLRARLRYRAPKSNPPPGPPLTWCYAFSMQKWIELLLPSSVQHLEPVSESGGLVLFSGIPNKGPVMKMRQWWPLVIVNPITRENRSLLLMLEPPAELDDDACYSELHMGLKVYADSKTYKVVVHWMNYYVVQTFDSGSNQWSTSHIPREKITYSSSSNEIIFCRNYEREDADKSSVFDIGHGKLVDYNGFIEFGRHQFVGNGKKTFWGFPSVGKSCLYVVSYDSGPVSFIRIHKRERNSVTWQLVTEVPKTLYRYLLVDEDKIYDTFQSEGIVDIHECGNHLLFTATYDVIWCGMLYNLDKRLWIRHIIVDENLGNGHIHHGLFFQPQLNGPPR